MGDSKPLALFRRRCIDSRQLFRNLVLRTIRCPGEGATVRRSPFPSVAARPRSQPHALSRAHRPLCDLRQGRLDVEAPGKRGSFSPFEAFSIWAPISSSAIRRHDMLRSPLFPNCSLGVGLARGVAWPKSRFAGWEPAADRISTKPRTRVVLVVGLGRNAPVLGHRPRERPCGLRASNRPAPDGARTMWFPPRADGYVL